MPKGENLHEAILNELYEFSYEVEQIVQEELDKGAQDLKNELKATSRSVVDDTLRIGKLEKTVGQERCITENLLIV